VRGVDFTGKLSQIRVPTLVIAGADDMGTPLSMSEAIANGIPGATLEVIDNASHLSVAEQPEKFASLVQGFLARVG
jgi:3-oxoadipate enol-lactonase